MKPRITYPRTVVLPKDLERLWQAVKHDDPGQSFNGWVSAAIQGHYYTELNMLLALDKKADEA